ncbi:hypothetical protein KCP73_03090 [Salmonella enterica subsp. enterica]|nr:hypothetical protein KCP73_03090 [Salmonella enterica subsp. enterica]
MIKVNFEQALAHGTGNRCSTIWTRTILTRCIRTGDNFFGTLQAPHRPENLSCLLVAKAQMQARQSEEMALAPSRSSQQDAVAGRARRQAMV